MKRKYIFLIVAIVVALVAGRYLVSYATKSITKFDAEERYVYHRDAGSAKEEIKRQIQTKELLQNQSLLFRVADLLNVWKHVTPGRFAIKKGASMWDIIGMLRKNRQSDTVVFTIKKLQTKEGLADIIERRFLVDAGTALQFLRSSDSLQEFQVDTNTVFTLITPDRYRMHYKSDMRQILKGFKNKTDSFWNANKLDEKAALSALNRKEAYILASIVEEETSKNDEKGNIASVYWNRLQKNMRLGADPTIKFALRNFDLRRILHVDLQVNSPYNTYRNSGLPPGPICTPSKETLQSMFPIPKTNYLFFVAKDDLSGYHVFTTNYEDHLTNAAKYQKELNERNIKR